MVWLNRSPIPVGRRGVNSSFQLFLPAFPRVEEGRVGVGTPCAPPLRVPIEIRWCCTNTSLVIVVLSTYPDNFLKHTLYSLLYSGHCTPPMHKPEVAVESKAFLGLIHGPHGSVKCETIMEETPRRRITVTSSLNPPT
jgi:hypothetical protein